MHGSITTELAIDTTHEGAEEEPEVLRLHELRILGFAPLPDAFESPGFHLVGVLEASGWMRFDCDARCPSARTDDPYPPILVLPEGEPGSLSESESQRTTETRLPPFE
jgi:hypothetical protein